MGDSSLVPVSATLRCYSLLHGSGVGRSPAKGESTSVVKILYLVILKIAVYSFQMCQNELQYKQARQLGGKRV